MYYDLHIHSSLSPCANDNMTPNNIVNMSLIKGLQLIAVTDHNSLRQQLSFGKVCKLHQIEFYYGVEIQTLEEVHILAYFKNYEDVKEMQEFIDKYMNDIPNDTDYFGNELIMDEFDQVVSYEPKLLLGSINQSLDQCIQIIHKLHGRVVLAHALGRSNSIITQLGFIPRSLDFDGIELKNEDEKSILMQTHPWLENKSTVYFFNSDAHQLTDINESNYQLTNEQLRLFWG